MRAPELAQRSAAPIAAPQTGGAGLRFGRMVLILFLLLMARNCAYGFAYYPQLDDYIQYHNYPAAFSFGQLQQVTGLLASRPLAGVADYFVWARLFSHMLLGVALVSLLYAVTAVGVKRLLERHFLVGPVFLAVMVLLPLGVEGTYWMSASTRVVVGLFFAMLTAAAFVRWLDRGGWGRLALYLLAQLVPFGFYEQAGIFSVVLTVGLALLECRRPGGPAGRRLWSLWGFGAMGLSLILVQALGGGGAYAGRAQLVLPNTPGYFTDFLPQVLRQVGQVFGEANFFLLAKGFVRGAREIFSGRLLFWALVLAALCLLFWRAARIERRGTGEKAAPLWLHLLAAGPVSLFFVLDNPWFSLRGAVPSLPGLALMADALVLWVWHRLALRWDGPAALAAVLAVVFCVAGASEIGDYRATYENDQQTARGVLAALQADRIAPGQRVGVLNVPPSSLPNQNYYYHEHIHGCTESSWAFQGLLTCLAGEGLPSVTPLPAAPVYRHWNRETARPDSFDVLYFWTEGRAVPVCLEQIGAHDFLVVAQNGTQLGVIWEEADGAGYFCPVPQG